MLIFIVAISLENFVARGYAKISDKAGNSVMIYADYDKHQARSLGYVANVLKNDTEEYSKDMYDDFRERVDTWVQKFKESSDPLGSDKW